MYTLYKVTIKAEKNYNLRISFCVQTPFMALSLMLSTYVVSNLKTIYKYKPSYDVPFVEKDELIIDVRPL